MRALRKTRLQNRLLAVCLLLSLIPVLVVGLFAYRVYTTSINRNLAGSAEQAVRLLNTTVASELGKFAAYINTISVSDTVQTILLRPESERILPDGSVALAIKQRVQEVPAQSRYLKNIRVVDRSGNVLYDLGFDDIPRSQFDEVLKGVEAASPNDSLQYVRTYRGVDALVLGRKIHQFARPRLHIGYILVYIQESLLSQSVYGGIDFGPGSNILLMDGRGRVLSSRENSLLGASFGGEGALLSAVEAARQSGLAELRAELGGEKHLVVFDYNRDLDTYFLATIPESVVTQETSRITERLALVAAVTAVMSLLVAILIYRSIVGPVRRVMRFCEEATQAKTEGHILDESPDELGYLARAIDRFVHEIQRLLHKSKQDERRKRALELEMLQYQINPHFLFNTLNTLKWVAVMNEVPVLSEGISSLSQLLQSTLLGTEEAVPLREELENVRHYISIQKIRFADSFSVDYAVDESLLCVPVPRFILQPLVENAIIHGAREDGRSVRITIGGERTSSGDIELTVRDDGQGFKAVDVQKKAREGFSGIGLSNVHERIRLGYGEPYGLAIESEIGAGTLCTITLRDR
ncbi:MAG: sensor histidine kinase [Clostridiales bacterium]|nr:sensor histidine kinase [Clostridiales bacterium]